MSGTSNFAKRLIPVVKNTIIVIACILVWIIILLPFLVFPFIILFVIRKLTDFFVLRLHRSYKPIQGVEALYAVAHNNNYSDKENHCFANVCCGFIVDGHVSAQQYRQEVESTLFRDKNSPTWSFWKLSSRPVKCCGYYYWKPVSKINLEDYIKECPEHFNNFDLDKILNDWMPLGFGEELSPWEIMVVRPRSGKLQDKSLILVKGSHVICDAVGVRDFILTSLHAVTEPKVIPPVIHQEWWISVFQFLTVPRMMLDACLDFLSSRWKSGRNKVRFNSHCNNGDSVNSWDIVDIALVKKAKRKLGCSFKDVLAHATGSALQNHMLTSGMKLPRKVTVLLNTHWPHAEHPGNLTVNAASFSVPFTMSESNTRKRIAKFHSEGQAKRKIGTYKLMYYSSRLLHLLPSFVMSSAGRWCLFKAYAITDIPFTINEDLYLLGNPVSGIYITVGLQGVPLLSFTGFVSLGSKLCVSFAANKLFINSQQEMEEVIQTFKKELYALAAHDEDDSMAEDSDKTRLTEARIC